MSDAGKFIAMVGLHFPPPRKVDDPEYAAWLTSMTISLRHYSDGVLGAAAAEIVGTRTSKEGRFFPLPSECKAVCDRHKRLQETEQTPLLSGPQDVPHEARVKLARDLMQSPMGQVAKREKWDTSLYHFCVENMRVPGGREVEDCKRSAREFQATYERCLKGDHPLGGPLARLAESMVRKARELMGERA